MSVDSDTDPASTVPLCNCF